MWNQTRDSRQLLRCAKYLYESHRLCVLVLSWRLVLGSERVVSIWCLSQIPCRTLLKKATWFDMRISQCMTRKRVHVNWLREGWTYKWLRNGCTIAMPWAGMTTQPFLALPLFLGDIGFFPEQREKAWAGLPGLKSSAASTFWRKPLWQPMLHLFIHSLMELSAGAKALHDWSHLVALRSANPPKRHRWLLPPRGIGRAPQLGNTFQCHCFSTGKISAALKAQTFRKRGLSGIGTFQFAPAPWWRCSGISGHMRKSMKEFSERAIILTRAFTKFNEEKRTAVLNRSDLNLLISHIFSVTGWPTLTSNSLAGVLLPREHSKTKQKKKCGCCERDAPDQFQQTQRGQEDRPSISKRNHSPHQCWTQGHFFLHSLIQRLQTVWEHLFGDPPGFDPKRARVPKPVPFGLLKISNWQRPGQCTAWTGIAK